METLNDILDFAIEREQQAADFYSDLVDMVALDSMKETFAGFSREELRHKAKLLSIQKNGAIQSPQEKVLDLKIADYMVDVNASANMKYQDALVVAMQRERVAFQLYSDLAEKIDDPGLKDAFQALAQEEAKHKLYFESEYDEKVLTDN